MAELPCMPMWWATYFGDTKHLTCLEHGAYDQIIGTMWLAGGELPDDDAYLIRVTKLDPRQWRRMKPTIMAFMRPTANGRFTQNKLLETIKAVQMKRAKLSVNARARWLKTKGLPDAIAVQMLSKSNAIMNKIETTLSVQSSTPPEKGSGSAEKLGEVADANAGLAPSPQLVALMQQKAKRRA
jgi:uncharacterized protein YdaU (DUF1376 family)